MATITRNLNLWTRSPGGRQEPRLGQLRFHTTRPFEVRLHLTTPFGGLEWLMERGMLAQGLYCSIGAGRVRIEPLNRGLLLFLLHLGDDGVAALTCSRRAVWDFLTRTYLYISASQEWDCVDWDQVVAQLLASGGPGGDR